MQHKSLIIAIGLSVLASVAHAEPLKIGTILSTTGPAAFLGEDMRDGMQLAIEDVNRDGGVNGQPVQWVFYDAESETAKALAATRRLLAQDRVDVVVGGGSMSGIAQAMVPMVQQFKTPFISTEGALSIVSPVAERPWVFKSTVDDRQVFERLARYLHKQGISRLALLHDTSGFGQSAAEELKELAPQLGLTATYEAFAPADTDLTSQLTRIKNSDAQAVLCWTVTPAGVIFIKQAHQLGLKLPLIHSYGFVSQRYMELAGADAEGVLFTSVKFPVGQDLAAADVQKAPISKLTQEFKARFGREPNQYVAQSYDAILLATKAFTAGHGDKAKSRDALEQIQGYPGVSGTFNFSLARHSGLADSDIVMVRWHDGRFQLQDD